MLFLGIYADSARKEQAGGPGCHERQEAGAPAPGMSSVQCHSDMVSSSFPHVVRIVPTLARQSTSAARSSAPAHIIARLLKFLVRIRSCHDSPSEKVFQELRLSERAALRKD